ncbi:hypothetical protein NNO_0413 [Hydrogenimonas sp.]|nr:hypothetical protein NNO_0413 [Hydrogenimonas sp.]
MRYLRRAFTLVELTFVILVFGIVAAIGSEIYAKIYENYLITRSINSLQTKTEIALEQIAKRLQYRIKSSAIGVTSDLDDFITTADPRLDESYTILEWIGYDETGLRGEYDDTTLNYFQPIWSGFIDVDNSTQTVISTPGSRLLSEWNLIDTLSHDSANIGDAAIIFPETGGDFNISRFGWYGNDSDYVFNINITSDTAFEISDPTRPTDIYERYKLVWTAFAIAPDPLDCQNNCDLVLYWNYQPWKGERFDTAQNVFKNLLLQNVTTFKFKQDGDVMRIKLCAGEKIIDNNISVCKEKVVF